MGLLDLFRTDSSAASRKTILSQQERIAELEEAIDRLSGEMQEIHAKFQEMTQLVTFIANAQQQMALDMNVIYESVQAVSDAMQLNAQEVEDKYFTWRWNIKDDDDDLPN